jgi:hypothetical protein
MSEIFPETPITSLPEAVAFMGALPVPVGPKAQPLALSEEQIDALATAGNRVVNDEVHQHLCMCDAWPEKCVSSGHYFMGAWDVDGLEAALPAVLGLWEQMRGGELAALRAQVAALLDERHSTNEALDDAVQELRARQSCPCPPADQPGPHQVGCFFDGVPVSPPSERPVNGLTATFAPAAALREVLDGEHYAYVHRSYLKGHDRPELGGAQ